MSSKTDAPDDQVEDFNSATGHMHICWKEEASSNQCNRDCHQRLYDLAVRLDGLLNPKPEGDAPECKHHNEVQHRDGKPPWCSRCGWFRGRTGVPPLKIGTSAAEREGVHQPWSPKTGWRQPVVNTGLADK